MTTSLLAVSVLFLQVGQGPEPQIATAVSVAGIGPAVDGRLDDPAWENAVFFSNFRQKEPNEGGTPSQRTEVAFLFDGDALYVGARLFSDDPGSITAQVTRRDDAGNSERIEVSLDPYMDRRTAYTFAVTAAGVRLDWYHPDDDVQSRDATFDPVWEARTSVDSEGWTAELRIPFSQLRFNPALDNVWGLNVSRFIPNLNEEIHWVVVPRTETGWASRFGALQGIESQGTSRPVELLPYGASSAEVTPESLRSAANPFEEATDFGGRVGLDLKLGLGSNFTLDATVNPDFAQVEADPAQVNLSAFETFFTERRPFFTEGSQLFGGSGPGYFYSRRIGSAPNGPAQGDFVDRPSSSTILGAAKITGRSSSGFSLGVLGAVTDREFARTFDLEAVAFDRSEVAPATSYGVVRAQQEVGAPGSIVGVTLTAMRRDFGPDRTLEHLFSGDAIAGGSDWRLRTASGEYEVSGVFGFSHVRGDPAAIERLQLSSRHYFQRPDQDHVELDPMRESLTGWTGSLGLAKRNGRHWVWRASLNAESPEFEINDAGRLGRADQISGDFALTYRETTPGERLRGYGVTLGLQPAWNFGGHRRQAYTYLSWNMTLPNFWRLNGSFWGGPGGLGDVSTRGGPLVELGKWWWAAANLSTNPGGRFVWRVGGNYWGAEPGNGGQQVSGRGGVDIRLGGRWQASTSVRYQWWDDNRQYQGVRDGGPIETFGERYLFAQVKRTQLSAQFRLNYSFTPDLSLEAYAEPFAASGRFYGQGELARAGSYDLRVFGTDGTTVTRDDETGVLSVSDGADSFSVPNSDFNVISFRSNLVLRWEWRRGSTFFLVWQRDHSDFASSGEGVTPSNLWDSVVRPGRDFLTAKFSYWLPVG
jgi:hypothetical protein